MTGIMLFLALAASLGTMPQPSQILFAQPAHSNCCAGMESSHHPKNDCGGKAPQSKEDRQCCAACALGLALCPEEAAGLLVSPEGDERFAVLILNERSRSDRPPTPPPRAAFA
jgi:hypothetical protein